MSQMMISTMEKNTQGERDWRVYQFILGGQGRPLWGATFKQNPKGKRE